MKYIILPSPTWGPSRVTELDRAGAIKKNILREKFPDLAENYPHDLGMWITQKERNTAIFLSIIGIIIALVNIVLVWKFLYKKHRNRRENNSYRSVLSKIMIAWNLVALVILPICSFYASWMASMGGPFRITELDRALVINEAKLTEDFLTSGGYTHRSQLGKWIAQKERRSTITLAISGTIIPVLNLMLVSIHLFKLRHTRYALLTVGTAILLRSLLFSLHGGQRTPDSIHFIVLDPYAVIGYWLIIVFLANSYLVRFMRIQQEGNKKDLSHECIFFILINGIAGGIIFGNLDPTYPQHSIWDWGGILFGGLVVGALTAITTFISKTISRKLLWPVRNNDL